MMATKSIDSSRAVAFRTADEKWRAVARRDSRADGAFVFCVLTTGVYCRPSCPARRARRENVRFYRTPAGAESAGFRACKRCRPNESSVAEHQSALIAKACRLIERAAEVLDLATLAKAAGMSRFHFHRLFKATTGLTPRGFAMAHRANQVRKELMQRDTVSSAIYSGGFNSSGRFYADASKILGMKPTNYRRGGEGESIQFALGECSLGSLLVAATQKGVCAIFIGSTPSGLERDLQHHFTKAVLKPGDSRFEDWVAEVVRFIETPERGLSLPLDIRGTAFQQRVWKALSDIPLGSTKTYSELAKELGDPRSVRAVAGACASNPVAISIPCHRVVRSDGSLAGYRWGIERKRALLQRESACAQRRSAKAGLAQAVTTT